MFGFWFSIVISCLEGNFRRCFDSVGEATQSLGYAVAVFPHLFWRALAQGLRYETPSVEESFGGVFVGPDEYLCPLPSGC